MRSLHLIGLCFVVLAGCVGDPPTLAGPHDAAPAQDQLAQDAAGDAGDAAPFDPTWTVPLQKGTSLTSIAVDANGDVYVVGSITEAFTLGNVTIPSTNGTDGFVMKLDGKTKQPVWAKAIVGSGSDIVSGVQADNGALFLVGTTDSPSVAFTKNMLNIPMSTQPGTRSFIAKLDPTDGADVYAFSPDANRSSNSIFFSTCNTISVVAKRIAVGCTYTGATFGGLPTANSAAIGILGFDDGFQANQTVLKAVGAQSGLVAFPSIALTPTGDIWVAATLRGMTTLVDLTDLSTVLTGTGTSNPFVLHVAPGMGNTKVLASRSWAMGNSGALPSFIRSVSTNGNQTFVSGQFFGSASLDTPVISSGLADGFALSLDATTLKTNWQYTLGGASGEFVTSVAADANGAAYLALVWGSPGLTFGKSPLPDPPNPNVLGAMGAIDAKGAPGAALVAKSVTTTSYSKIIVDKYVYGVGQYQGATTFDDGTTATGSISTANAFIVRRAKF